MTAILAAETLVLLLLSLLVAGLLRSHAEILRRLPPETQKADDRASTLSVQQAGGEARTTGLGRARRIEGLTPLGASAVVEFAEGAPSTLIAFLSSGCGTCQAFWDAFSRPRVDTLLAGVQLVVVTESSESESPARVKKLMPKRVPVVMSSAAWRDYEVMGSPYFAYVDGTTAQIRGEGTAGDWEQLARLVQDAIADAELSEQPASVPGAHLSDSHPDRIREADRALMAAGIGPDHPSLWPEGRPPRDAAQNGGADDLG